MTYKHVPIHVRLTERWKIDPKYIDGPTFWKLAERRRKMTFITEDRGGGKIKKVVLLGVYKRCPRCGEVKDLGLFKVDSLRNDGHHSQCSECTREGVRVSRALHGKYVFNR